MITQPFSSIWMVKNYSNCYLVDLGDHLVIIDAGMDKKAKELIEAIEKTSKKPTAVLITHGHLDHINGLSALKKKYPEIKILASEEDKPAVEGKEYLLPKGIKGFFFRLLMPLMYKPVSVDETFQQQFEQFQVIKAPGHTKGSVCFLLDKMLFCGDLIVNTEKGLDIPPQEFNFSKDQLIASIREIEKTNFTHLLSGHGDVVTDAKAKLPELLKKLGF